MIATVIDALPAVQDTVVFTWSEHRWTPPEAHAKIGDVIEWRTADTLWFVDQFGGNVGTLRPETIGSFRYRAMASGTLRFCTAPCWDYPEDYGVAVVH